MNVVASCGKVKIYRYKIDYFSLFNSPYYAHSYGGALDIYFLDEERVFPCLTPGRIVDIRTIKATSMKKFPHSEFDYVILIESREDPSLIVRLMHVKPFVKEGDCLDVGSPIGMLLRSGFFDPWTSLHAHLEVKYPSYAFRAKGSIPMTLNIDGEIEGEAVEDIFFRVVQANDYFVLVKLKDECTVRVGRVGGLGVRVGENLGILDCGFPHYKRGGVIVVRESKVRLGDQVRLGGLVVGRVNGFIRNGVQISLENVSLECEGVRLRGISTFLSLNEKCLMKLIPLKGEKIDFRKGEVVQLKLHEEGFL